jgi:hypothetical protein
MSAISRTAQLVLIPPAAAAMLAGCIAVGGNEHYTKPTLGRQLMDLKTARDTGAVSEQEYEHAKEDLLRGRVSSAQVE